MTLDHAIAVVLEMAKYKLERETYEGLICSQQEDMAVAAVQKLVNHALTIRAQAGEE